MFFKGCRSDSSGDSAPCLLFTLPISEKKRRAGPAAGPRRMRHSLCSKGMKYFTILQEFSFRAEKKRNRTGAAGVCAAKREGAGGRGCRRCGEASGGGGAAKREGSGGRGAGDAGRLRVPGGFGCRGGVAEREGAGGREGVGVWEQGERRIRARREGIECRRRRNEARGKAGTGRASGGYQRSGKRGPGRCREPEIRCTGTENHRNSPGNPQIRRKPPKIITLA